MKILITGGAGFIGSHTADALLAKGHEVRILDNLQKPVHLKGMPDWLPKEAEFIEGDVRDSAAWDRALVGVEAVYHLAAYQDYLPDFSTFFHVNAVGTALLYERALAQGLDLAKVIVASSQFVQGEGLYKCRACEMTSGPAMRPESQLKKGIWEQLCLQCGKPLTWQWTAETHAAPPNAYAMSKYSQELQAISFGQRYNIPSVALRYSIVQGPRQSFYNAYSGACRIFSLNYYFDRAPVIYEDGQQCRDFVNIHDVVDANLLALVDERLDYGVFNVGGGEAYSVKDFAEIVRLEVQSRKDTSLPAAEVASLPAAEIASLPAAEIASLPAAEIPGLYRFGDTRNACSDISKLKALGWEPKHTPVESVKEYVAWLYEQDNVEDILDYAMKTMQELDVVRRVVG